MDTAQPAEERDGAEIGARMHALATRLFPIARSLTGAGVRETLRILQGEIPGLQLHEVPSGTQCFDWQVPKEWVIRDAYLFAPDGTRMCRFRDNNLHVVGYSVGVDRELTLDELQPHLHSLPAQPEAIPYVTSYYRPQWGFCLTHRQREGLRPGTYRAVVDAEHIDGSLTYGELLLPATEPTSAGEILISSYMCHPSMANNELSGPCVVTALAGWLAKLPRRRHSYRIVLTPETIGSLCYLSRHHEQLRRDVVAGFVVTCVGDDRAYSYLPSRAGNTRADRVALHVLETSVDAFTRYTFQDRGSDERQYCAPGIDLPVASIMRSKYHTYPEYHTSLDDLTLVTPSGLYGGYRVLRDCLRALELNRRFRTTVLGEPQLGRRGLYPTTSLPGLSLDRRVRVIRELLAYGDGEHDLLDIAGLLRCSIFDLEAAVADLEVAGLLRPVADGPA